MRMYHIVRLAENRYPPRSRLYYRKCKLLSFCIIKDVVETGINSGSVGAGLMRHGADEFPDGPLFPSPKTLLEMTYRGPWKELGQGSGASSLNAVGTRQTSAA